MARDLLIIGGRIIDADQNIDAAGDLLISDGKFSQIGSPGTLPSKNADVIDAAGCIVCQGFIDLHCHLRDPGFEEKETIATGTKAAAAGGFTTVCCMPNTNPPIDSRASVEYVIRTAAQSGTIRVLPIGCITKGRKGAELSEMYDLADAGVIGFSDDGSTVANPQLLQKAMEYSRTLGLPIIEHCEDPMLAKDGYMHEGWVSTRLGLKGVPTAAEEVIIARDIALAQLTKAKLHIAHVSTAGSVEMIRRAKEAGISITAEVTPHHLTLTHERVMRTGRGNRSELLYDTNAKVNPPLRTEEDIAALIAGLKAGVIDCIATDHAPHHEIDKLCEFGLAAFGISGFETALGSLMTLVHNGHLDMKALIAALTAVPSRILGKNYGIPAGIKIGSTADIVIFDPDKEWTVRSSDFASKGKNTPLEGQALKGKVKATIYYGAVVYSEG
ncbi:MAG TPA: dihydroorotase [Dehalococcoidia bacterium]|nr:dihydroorotase [Dehalococcoidia bacterium]